VHPVKKRVSRNYRRARVAFAAIVFGTFMLAVSGCQTVQGFGKDITAAGEAGEQLLQGG